jgi:hypothetical protein
MVQAPVESTTLYPDSDGKPMADNILQYRWIVRLVTNLKQLLQKIPVSSLRNEIAPSPSFVNSALTQRTYS